MYLFLISQHDLNACGVIGLWSRRWAATAAGLNLEQVAADLAELEQARFIITDADTDELLVRSFMRRNDVSRNANLRTKAMNEVASTVSPNLRKVLATELSRMGLGEGHRDGHREGHQEGLFEGLEEGGVGTTVIGIGTSTGTSGTCTTDNQGDAVFDRFWAAYPRKVGKLPARKAWDKAITRANPDKIITAAVELAERADRMPPAERKFIPHPKTWLGADRWDDEPEDSNQGGGEYAPFDTY